MVQLSPEPLAISTTQDSSLEADRKTRAVAAVRERHEGANQFKILHSAPEFLRGALYTVKFTDTNNCSHENYVYFYDNKVSVFLHVNELTREAVYHVNNLKRELEESKKWSSIIRALRAGGISSVIAVIITIAICYIAIIGDKDIPEVLSNALTMILGFYFGTQVSKNDQEAQPS